MDRRGSGSLRSTTAADVASFRGMGNAAAVMAAAAFSIPRPASRSVRPLPIRSLFYDGAMLIRDATADDARGIARVHVETWQAGYRGLMPQDVLDALEIDDRAERWIGILTAPDARSRTLIADVDGTIVGWASFGDARDDLPAASGELWGIYVHPDSWSTGAGHALLTAVEDALRDASHDGAYLWVLDGNERAARFYERHGWAEDGGTKIDERPAVTLWERRRVKQLVLDQPAPAEHPPA